MLAQGSTLPQAAAGFRKANTGVLLIAATRAIADNLTSFQRHRGHQLSWQLLVGGRILIRRKVFRCARFRFVDSRRTGFLAGGTSRFRRPPAQERPPALPTQLPTHERTFGT